MAATAAEEFARVAFVERNADAAYALVWQEWKRELSLGMLIEKLKQIHPAGFPAQVFAEEYEPISDKPAMAIFLHGENDAGEQFFYRFVMAGSVDSGYRVGGFFRGNGPYPASATRRALHAGLAVRDDVAGRAESSVLTCRARSSRR